MNPQRKYQRGFTLIELMIVVVILGIITTIAVQSYSGASKDGERARILSEMKSLNDAVNRYYQGNYSYTDAADGAKVPVAAVRGTIEQSKQYDVTLVIAADGQSYFLVAKPKATGIMKGDGTLWVDNLGNHCAHPASDDADPASDACTRTW